MVNIFFELSIVIVLGFLIRFIFAISQSSDVWVNLWYAQKLSESKTHPCSLTDSIISGYSSPSYLPYYIISKFPKRLWVLAGKLLNVAYDCFSLILVYFVSRYIFADNYQQRGFFISPNLAIVLLSATAPILFTVKVRLGSLGGRTMGNLLNISYFILFGYAFLCRKPLVYLPCIILGILIILSSQFGMQNWIITSAVISLLYLNPTPLLCAIAAVAIGMVIPHLGIKEIMLQKLNHYRWYFVSIRGTTADGRNNLTDILSLPAYLKKQPRKFLSLVFNKITPVIIFYSMPVLVILLFWIAKSPQDIAVFTDQKVFFYLSVVSIAGIVAFIIASLRPFLFLGEAERYFEYNVFYIDLLFVYFIIEKGKQFNMVFWLLLLQIIVVLISYLHFRKEDILKALNIKDDETFSELLDFLRKGTDLRVISIPTKLNPRISVYLDKPSALFYYDFITDRIDGFRYMRDDSSAYLFIRPDFEYFRDKYKINTLVVQKRDLVNAQRLGINYNFNRLEKKFDNDEYAVYRIA